MATYKVSYFKGKGNGEIIRLALIAAGQKFEDERLDREEWLKIKPDTPTKQMPLLAVTEGGKTVVFAQSAACAKYIARKYGLFGENEQETLLIDEVFESLCDLQKDVAKFYYEKDEERKKELKTKFVEETLTGLNEYIGRRAKEFGQKGFIIGPKMTIADLHLYNLVDQISGAMPGLLDPFEEIKKHADVVKADPRIQKWIEEMPKPQF